MTFILIVDGIIGCGKTTLIRKVLIPYLENQGFRVREIAEPVDQWKQSGRLEQFYKDPQRRSFQFQIAAFHSRVRKAQEAWRLLADTTDIFVLERSIFTDLLFAQVLHNQKLMDDTEFEDYRNLHQMWTEVMPFRPHLFVFLQPTLALCMHRLRQRQRPGEESVTEEYQQLLLDQHHHFFQAKHVSIDNSRIPILTLQGDADYLENARDRENLMQQLLPYLSSISVS